MDHSVIGSFDDVMVWILFLKMWINVNSNLNGCYMTSADSLLLHFYLNVVASAIQQVRSCSDAPPLNSKNPPSPPPKTTALRTCSRYAARPRYIWLVFKPRNRASRFGKQDPGVLDHDMSGREACQREMAVVLLYPWNEQLAPENGWLEYDRFLLGDGLFSEANC